MSSLDKKITEALRLEAAKDKAAEDARRSAETKMFFREKRRQEFRDEIIVPAFDGLNDMLKSQEPPHYVEFDEVAGREFVAKIRAGTGEGEPGPVKLAVKLILAEDQRAPAFVSVHGQVGKGADWVDEPVLSGDTYRVDVQQLSNRIVDLWIGTHNVAPKAPQRNSW